MTKNLENSENIIQVTELERENLQLKEENATFKTYIDELEHKLHIKSCLVECLKTDNFLLTVDRNELQRQLDFKHSHDNFVEAELLAQQYEQELVNDFGSFIGDD